MIQYKACNRSAGIKVIEVGLPPHFASYSIVLHPEDRVLVANTKGPTALTDETGTTWHIQPYPRGITFTNLADASESVSVALVDL